MNRYRASLLGLMVLALGGIGLLWRASIPPDPLDETTQKAERDTLSRRPLKLTEHPQGRAPRPEPTHSEPECERILCFLGDSISGHLVIPTPLLGCDGVIHQGVEGPKRGIVVLLPPQTRRFTLTSSNGSLDMAVDHDGLCRVEREVERLEVFGVVVNRQDGVHYFLDGCGGRWRVEPDGSFLVRPFLDLRSCELRVAARQGWDTVYGSREPAEGEDLVLVAPDPPEDRPPTEKELSALREDLQGQCETVGGSKELQAVIAKGLAEAVDVGPTRRVIVELLDEISQQEGLAGCFVPRTE